MDRLGPVDATFYHLESPTTPMHVGSVSVLEGPPPSLGELEGLVAAKLRHVPRYRQRVRPVPLGLGRPVWVDDRDFELGHHVRHVTVPGPGGDEEVRAAVARILEQPLDLTRPPWEVWLVDGLAGDRWAVVAKVHHCMVDGIAGTDLLALVFDPGPDTEPGEPDAWQPTSEPSTVGLVAGSLRGAVADTGHQTLAQLGALRRLASPGEWVRRTEAVTAAVLDLTRQTTAATAHTLNGPLGRRRRWAWSAVELSTVRRTRRALGGTDNDVVLAAVTGGLRDLLAGRDELTDRLVVRTLVPVSVRRSSERGQVGNRITTVLVDLPVGQADPLARLAAVRRQMEDHKRLILAVDTRTMLSAGDLVAPAMLALGARTAGSAQPVAQAVATNVPGPPRPLYALGRRMVSLHAHVPIAMGCRLAIGIFSYAGSMTFGINADHDGVPDADVLAEGIVRGLAELAAAAGA
ncbi:wax ester/triacylglycerol synthase family O-acyltransferase [Actinomycetospora sp. TBRC 11914]|uniref:WS/DGAT/MGAT family O-acyltransferase n=1 Tax=Actinomycetospora sp. TBRC 11914 TaxID=2729387 RepID=UPI00145C40F6|nr:wax ester/triacylglycerol synthase family O-acyltransferase [Actinomycetospora sp. TBRC 11914]NMO92331.1 wax ester/triacylglycerol synthase family O-acyltransferase [Actinomycetospora sp. TBRC 11914]